jgi:hypothetical protein
MVPVSSGMLSVPLSNETLALARGALRRVPEAVGALIDEYGSKWVEGSRADSEIRAYARPESVETAFSQASSSLIVAGDHCFALDRALTEPVQSLAGWTLARAVLESASVAVWLLDPSIDAVKRVERSLSLRLRDLEDQVTVLRSDGRLAQSTPEHPDPLNHAIDRVDSVIHQAEELSLNVLRNRKGRVVGFGEGIPNATDLAEACFKDSVNYRLMSAVAHNRTWAKLAVGFRRVDGRKAVTQHMEPVALLFLVVKTLQWFTLASWHEFELYGWDLAKLAAVLDLEFERAKIPENRRFWRSYRGARSGGGGGG